MRFGLGSYACGWAVGAPGYPPERPLGVPGFLELAHTLGYRLVQIADNLPLHELSRGELQDVKAQADALGIAVEVGTRGIKDGNLERYLELATFFASPILRVVADAPGHEPSPDEVAQTFADIVPDVAAAGVKLALENHDRFGTAALLDILRRVDSPWVGICLDTVNSFGALEGPEVVVERLAPFVINLHLKDFVVERAGHNMGFRVTGAPLGEGRLELDWLLDTFKDRPDMSAILEHWPAPESTLEATIAKESDWLRRSTATVSKLSGQR